MKHTFNTIYKKTLTFLRFSLPNSLNRFTPQSICQTQDQFKNVARNKYKKFDTAIRALKRI